MRLAPEAVLADIAPPSDSCGANGKRHQLLKPEAMVLRNGHNLLDVWPDPEGVASGGGALIGEISATDVIMHSAERLIRAASDEIRAIGRGIAKKDGALLKTFGES